ncbi:unnamed protein product [Trichobilharzia szidati]|nr:unnamed protein product [Trichobilharzia szidati]
MLTKISIFLWLSCLSGIFSIANPVKWIPLTGNWIISNKTTSNQIHTLYGLDSYSAQWLSGNTNDPFKDYNDVSLKWIGYDNWTFSKTFTIEQYHLNKSTVVELHLDGIDTFCDIILNNYRLGTTENSFLSYTWRINHLLNLQGINTLELKCMSTVFMAKRMADALKAQRKSIPPPVCWPGRFHGECHINLVRTTQSIFGWDWGLSLPIQGFWVPPKLIISSSLPSSASGLRFGEGFKFYAYSEQHESKQTWNAEISVEIVINAVHYRRYSKPCISAYIKGLNVFSRKCFTLKEKSMIHFEILRNYSNVKLWWPIGIQTGPYLYTLVLYLTDGFYRLIDRKEYSVGFREVELIQEYVEPSDTGFGRTFYFKINNLPVFIKGANWIPARYMPGRQDTLTRNTSGDIFWLEKRLLRSAALSGINLIRIWGGGRYENDEFYNEADKLGLMIWHDMMFAVSTYPDKESTDTVDLEIKRQISRLHYHPSIVVWSTDNEVKQAIANGWYQRPMDPNLLSIYKSRFIDSIFTVINKEEATSHRSKSKYKPRVCLISSPGNGYMTEQFKGLDPDPDNPLFGDIHFYIYFGNLWSESNFKVSRFISEFGLQSMPSALAWARSITNISDSKQWNIFDSLMNHRQHHSLGSVMLQLPLEYINAPIEKQDPIRNYSRWAYISQLNQLMCLRAQINLYMRNKCRLKISTSTVLNTDKLITMGTIYWQLNDIWSAPSWSTIDSSGQWKLSHYAAIREFYDIPKWGRIAIHNKDDAVIEADWIPNVQTNDNTVYIPNEFEIICYTIWSFEPTYREILNISSVKNGQCPISVLNKSLKDLNKLCRFNGKSGRIIQVGMKVGQKYKQSDGGLLLLDAPKKIQDFPKDAGSGLRLKSIQSLTGKDNLSAYQQMAPFQTNYIYELIIEAKSPELFVNLDLDPILDVEFWYSFNGFHLVSERQRKVYLYISPVDRMIPIDVLKSSIWIESLATLYN